MSRFSVCMEDFLHPWIPWITFARWTAYRRFVSYYLVVRLMGCSSTYLQLLFYKHFPFWVIQCSTVLLIAVVSVNVTSGPPWGADVWSLVVWSRWPVWLGNISTWCGLYIWSGYSCSVQSYKWALSYIQSAPTCHGRIQLVSGELIGWLQMFYPTCFLLYCMFLCFQSYPFCRIRMWWLSLVLQIIVIDVGIWPQYWKLGRTWIRIFYNLTRHLGKLSLMPHARLLIIFCDYYIVVGHCESRRCRFYSLKSLSRHGWEPDYRQCHSFVCSFSFVLLLLSCAKKQLK